MTTLPAIFKTKPTAMLWLSKAEQQIDQAERLDEINDISRMADALRHGFRNVKDVAEYAGWVQVKAEWKLGGKLKPFPKAQRGAGPGRGKVGQKAKPTLSPTIADLGLTKMRSALAQKLAGHSIDQLEKLRQALSEVDKPIAPRTILAADRQRIRTEKKHTLANAVFSEGGPFGTVIIDPPWPITKIDLDERPEYTTIDYPTMTADEIVGFFNDQLSPRLEPDCHLFMWTTQKWLPFALTEMLDRINFRYVLTMVWHKSGGFQPLDLPQYNCEFVVYARRGTPLFIDTSDFWCCFHGERREHSRKPEVFYDTIRRVTGGSRIDVFSREARDGFAQYGNEIGKFSEVA